MNHACAGRVGDDYEVLSDMGAGTFVPRVASRDLSWKGSRAEGIASAHRNRGRASLHSGERQSAAQLAHPSIVPIYDWDSRGDLSVHDGACRRGISRELIARSVRVRWLK